MLTEVALIVPTLGRAEKLEPLAENVAAATPPCFRLLFVCDPFDAPTWEVMETIADTRVNALEFEGRFAAKNNAGVRATREPFLVLAGDDCVFHPGWWEAARAAFEPGVEVVGTRDLTPISANGEHSTQPILRRSYIEDPGAVWGERGTVMHEGYHHNWTETELWQLAVRRGVARFCAESVIEHRHPIWGTAEVDATYRRGAFANVEADRRLFETRRVEWQEQPMGA